MYTSIFNNRNFLTYAQLLGLGLSIAALIALSIFCPLLAPAALYFGYFITPAATFLVGTFIGVVVLNQNSNNLTAAVSITAGGIAGLAFGVLLSPLGTLIGTAAVAAVTGSYLFKSLFKTIRERFFKKKAPVAEEQPIVQEQPEPANDAQAPSPGLTSSQRMLASLGGRQPKAVAAEPTSAPVTYTPLRSLTNTEVCSTSRKRRLSL
jgi:hypothetical protein